MTLEAIAGPAGTDTGNLSRIERGQQNYSYGLLEGIASALGIRVWELFYEAETGEQSPHIRSVDAMAPLPPGYVRLELLDCRASAGTGAENDDHPEVLRYLDVLEAHLREVLGVAPAGLRLLTAWDDSMAQTITRGNVLFVDVTVTAYRHPAVYMLRRDGHLLVKRLRALMDGRLEVRSDNPAYPPEYLCGDEAARLAVVGRVAGTWPLTPVCVKAASAGTGSTTATQTPQTEPAESAAALRLDVLLRQLYQYPPEVIKAALAEIGLQPPAPPVPAGGLHVEAHDEFLEATTTELAERRYERERRQAEQAAADEKRRRDRRGA